MDMEALNRLKLRVSNIDKLKTSLEIDRSKSVGNLIMVVASSAFIHAGESKLWYVPLTCGAISFMLRCGKIKSNLDKLYRTEDGEIVDLEEETTLDDQPKTRKRHK